MKKTIVIGLIAFAAFAFKQVSDKTQAVAECNKGVNIFMFSKPTAKFDYLGTVKVSYMRVASIDHILKKVKEDYPTADGVLVADDFYSAQVIKFKD